MSDRQSLLGSHQQSWWFNEINYFSLSDNEVNITFSRIYMRMTVPHPPGFLVKPGMTRF